MAKRKPKPPQPPSPIAVTRVKIGETVLENGASFTPEALAGKRIVAEITGSPVSVSGKLTRGIALHTFPTQTSAPWDWALPAMTAGTIPHVLTIEPLGGQPFSRSFTVTGSSGGGDSGGGGDTSGDTAPPLAQWAVGPRLDRGGVNLRINGWKVNAGGNVYAWWGESIQGATARWFSLKGNSNEATVRFSSTKNDYNQDITLSDGEIWGHAAPLAYTNAGKMPKPTVAVQAGRRFTIRRLKTHGVGPGVGVIAEPEHTYLKNIVCEDILIEDCDFYPDTVPMSGARVEITIGSRRVTYQNIRLHDAGEAANGTALIGIGGKVDRQGMNRHVDDLTIRAWTGTLKYSGIPIVADWGNPRNENGERVGGMEANLLLENNDIRLNANPIPARWPTVPLWFPNGWKAGWVSRSNTWPSYGKSIVARVGIEDCTADRWRQITGGNDRFV